MFKARLVIFCLIAEIVFANNYCDVKLCRRGTHIGCKHSKKFAKSCPKDRAMVPINSIEKELILNLHNTMRNNISSGIVTGFKGATKMSMLYWDDELAELAKLNVMQCKMKHDECRNTAIFKNAGQNLGYRGSSIGFEKTLTFIENVIRAWYDEIKDAKPADIESCPESISKVGHFFQIIQDKATHLGCAIAKYSENGFKNLLLACNYSYSNVLKKAVYATGNSTSKCGVNGTNSIFTSLCN